MEPKDAPSPTWLRIHKGLVIWVNGYASSFFQYKIELGTIIKLKEEKYKNDKERVRCYKI